MYIWKLIKESGYIGTIFILLLAETEVYTIILLTMEEFSISKLGSWKDSHKTRSPIWIRSWQLRGKTLSWLTFEPRGKFLFHSQIWHFSSQHRTVFNCEIVSCCREPDCDNHSCHWHQSRSTTSDSLSAQNTLYSYSKHIAVAWTQQHLENPLVLCVK